MTLPDNFVFSQSSLQDYVDCPRRFQLRYIDKLRYPTVDAQPAMQYEERTRQGARFHKVVQQYFAGIPSELLSNALTDDETLSRWWDSFLTQWLHKNFEFRSQYVEHTLQTSLGHHRLIAKYDLIGVGQDGAITIFDWKTYRHVPKRNTLKNRMQTKVYLYVLSQASKHLANETSISPDNMSMIYWFVDDDSQIVSFEYSVDDMRQHENELMDLIQQIESANKFWLTDDTRKCQFCSYRSVCNRTDAIGDVNNMLIDDVEDDDIFDVDFDQIAEIEF